MRGPKLPSRDRKNDSGSQTVQGPGPPLQGDAGQAIHQLSSHPVFKQFVDQPDKLLAVLQQDQVLADAAANSPDIAALLEPNTLRQALAVLQGGGPDDSEQQQQQPGAATVQRKALMQLQNYALQLQQARAAGGGPVLPLQVQSAPAFGAAGSPQEGSGAAGGVSGNSMWAAMQQRLNKFQQRSSVLGMAVPGAAAHGNPGSPSLQQQQQASNPSRPLPSPWTSALVQQQQLFEQEAQQYPLQDPPQQPPQAQPAQHSRPRDVPGKDTVSRAVLHHSSSGSMGSTGASPRVGLWLSRLAMPEGAGGSSGRVMSPLGRVTSPLAPGLGTSSSTQLSPGSMAALQRRSSSSLSHRLLRHSAASPLDLTDLQRSGSQALNVEQLESGDVIVDITPPTRVTQDLAWSTDPTAEYVLDAASSGSFGHLQASDSSTHLPVSTLTAAATPSSSSMLAAAPAGAVAASPAGAGAYGTFGGLEDSVGREEAQAQLYALPLLGDRSGGSASCQSNAQAAGDAGSSSKAGDSQASAAGAASSATAVSGRRSSNSNRQRASPQKLLLRVRQEQQSGGRAQPQSQPQQQLTEDHYSYIDLSDPAEQAAALASKQAMEQQFQAQQLQQQQQNQQQYQQQQYQQQQYQQQQGHDAAAGTALAGAQAAAAAGGSLDARTYYENVAPSTWRPTDVGSAPGDYLELYRRAYCSYADALFPPLWMALLGTLATLQLMPLWQLCLLGVVTFWGGMWLMAIKWAGVPSAQLGLSRVTPVLTVCLELTCTGAFITQVLPVMWLGHSLLCMVLLVCCCAMVALHLTAYLQDPGYTPLPDAEEGSYAAHLRPSANSSKRGTDTTANNGQAMGSAAGTNLHAAASESTPLLRSQQQPQDQAGSSAAGPAWGGAPMDHCWTCRVKRNLRSKHCPICKRCVERFDHHCPVLGNCVGAGNHKTFVAFLAFMFVSQLLFCHLVTSMLTQAYLMQLPARYNSHVETALPGSVPVSSSARGAGAAASGAVPGAATDSMDAAGGPVLPSAAGVAGRGGLGLGPATGARVPLQQQQQDPLEGDSAGASAAGADDGGAAATGGSQRGWWSTLKGLWAAGSTHMGLVLLLLAQVPTMFMSGFLLFRALGLAAANLTVNEWMNRQRYVHLHYTGAGFSNRFDRGVGANCYEFWCGPKFVDYWQSWEAGDQEMQRKGTTVLVPWSPTTLVRYWDLRWAKYQQRLMSSRARRKELQMHRRMLALGLPAQAS